MALEWTLTAGVGLMIGISLGVLVQLRYIVQMDNKLEHLLQRMARIELRTEREVLTALKKRTVRVKARSVKKVKRKPKRKVKKKPKKKAKRTTKRRRR